MIDRKIVAVIVNWNGRDLTLRLLESIARSTVKPEIVVVDNGSSDGSAAAIRAAFPDVVVMELPVNKGYSAGINAGLERSRSMGARFHWVFNNDVEVEPETLARMIEAFDTDDKIGVVGPLVFDHATNKLAHAGYKINMWTGWMTELGRPHSDKPYEVDSAFGCSNLIRDEVVEAVGSFDESYNVYFDETDYNARTRRAGFKVVVAPDAKVRHEESATMNKRILHKAWLLLANLLRFELKNATAPQLAVFLPYYFLIHLPYFLVRGSIQALVIKFGGAR